MLLSLLFIVSPSLAADGFRDWVTLRDQGVVRQSLDYSCGLAALATVMSSYFRIDTSESDLLALLESRGSAWSLRENWRDRGVSFAVLRQIANQFGLQGQGVRISAETLVELAQPAIVYLEHQGMAHFSVLRGVSREGGVQLADPSWGNRRLRWTEFLPLWLVEGGERGKLLLLWPGPGSGVPAGEMSFAVDSPLPLLNPP